MRPRQCTLLFLLVALVIALGGCLKHSKVDPSAVEVLRSGAFDLECDADVSNIIYVDVQGQTEGLADLVPATEAKLRRAGYETTNNPSKAGHILHLNILHCGKAQAEDMRDAVNKGYGGPLRFMHGEGTGLVADALLVQRRIPTHKRPSFVRLKNISNRNAVGNSQMRFGLLLPYGMREIPPAFVEVLSSELAAALQPTQALPPRQGDGQGRAR